MHYHLSHLYLMWWQELQGHHRWRKLQELNLQNYCEAAKTKPEPRPQPYRVAWVDKTSMAVSKTCLERIQFTPYQEQIWLDVLPMDVAHILSGRPWLFNKSVTHFGRTNTYVLEHDGKRITLSPSKLKNTPSNQSSTPQASTEPRKPLYILNKR